MDNRVKVGVRIRPMVPYEIDAGATVAAMSDKNNRSVIFSHPTARKSNAEFDWVFPQNATQVQVYDALCKPLIDKIFEGFNATVFAYGQT